MKNRMFQKSVLLVQAGVWAAAMLATSAVQAAMTVSDSRGEHQLTAPPQRVVVLNWDLAEQVLELDVQPIGVPNIPGYQEWVVQQGESTYAQFLSKPWIPANITCSK